LLLFLGCPSSPLINEKNSQVVYSLVSVHSYLYQKNRVFVSVALGCCGLVGSFWLGGGLGRVWHSSNLSDFRFCPDVAIISSLFVFGWLRPVRPLSCLTLSNFTTLGGVYSLFTTSCTQVATSRVASLSDCVHSWMSPLTNS